MIASVRSFNRVVTERVGALQESFLARGRPLGASRVLWEVGDGADVRELRARLDLDSGYVSRLLRGLEAEGLVSVEPDPADRRVRRVRLTAEGRAERAALDERSDALAGSLLAPLSERQRTQLVEAMGTVERLLTAGLVEVAIEDPASAAARVLPEGLLRRARRALRRRLRSRPLRRRRRRPSWWSRPACCSSRGCATSPWATERCASTAASGRRSSACGSRRAARGLGVGRRILAELEAHARRRGVTAIRLETNRNLHEAIALYRSAGYEEIERFSPEPYAHHWFEKRL